MWICGILGVHIYLSMCDFVCRSEHEQLQTGWKEEVWNIVPTQRIRGISVKGRGVRKEYNEKSGVT